MKFSAFFKGYDHVLPELALCVAAMYLVAVCVQREFLPAAKTTQNSAQNSASSPKTTEGTKPEETPVPTKDSQPSKETVEASTATSTALSPVAGRMVLEVLGPVGSGKPFGRFNGSPITDLSDLRSRIAQQQAGGKLREVVVRYSPNDETMQAIKEIMAVIFPMRIPVQLENVK